MSIAIEVIGMEEVRDWAADLNALLTRAASDEVEAESEALANDITAQMPVDTGWAQSRWGETAVPGGVWEVRDNGLTIEQGSDLKAQLDLFEYITRLNEGSSKQAPAGFLDASAARAEEKLGNRLEQIADMIP